VVKKRTIIIILAIVVLALLAWGITVFIMDSSGVKPSRGFVPDEAAAIRIAEAIWDAHYKDSSYSKYPIEVTRSPSGYWHVTGTLPENMLGGVPEIKIRSSDGKILYMSHGK